MLKDNWVSGVGIGKFKARFNECQADFFADNPIDSKRALLADNTFYVFNDYLQLVIENGLIGIVFFAIFLYLTIRRIIYLFKTGINKTTVTAASSILICLAVAALFSYPLETLGIQATVLICLIIIAFCLTTKRDITIRQKSVSIIYRILVLVLVVFFASNSWNERYQKKMEKEAFLLSRSGYKTAAINLYQKIINKYPTAGYNWFMYAQQLYYTNQLPAAYQALKKGMVYYVDNTVYKLKGDIERELAMYDEAEKSYLRTIYMVPNRMNSRLDLLHFYISQKDTTKAIYWAKSIINMPVKIPSEKLDRMLQETKLLIKKIQ